MRVSRLLKFLLIQAILLAFCVQKSGFARPTKPVRAEMKGRAYDLIKQAGRTLCTVDHGQMIRNIKIIPLTVYAQNLPFFNLLIWGLFCKEGDTFFIPFLMNIVECIVCLSIRFAFHLINYERRFARHHVQLWCSFHLEEFHLLVVVDNYDGYGVLVKVKRGDRVGTNIGG